MTVDGRLYWQKFKDHSDIQEWKVDMTELSHINYFTLELKKKNDSGEGFELFELNRIC